jgi:hypothetical protein
VFKLLLGNILGYLQASGEESSEGIGFFGEIK